LNALFYLHILIKINIFKFPSINIVMQTKLGGRYRDGITKGLYDQGENYG